MFCSRWKCLLLCYLFCTPTAQAEIRAWTVNNSKINADVVEVTQLSQLGLLSERSARETISANFTTTKKSTVL